MAGGGPPRSNLRNGGFLDSAQHREAERRRAERVRREREAYRRAGLVHRSEPNYEQKVKKQFTDYAQKAHGLSRSDAEKQYREVIDESYLAGQGNVGGQSAPGGGSAFNINTISRTRPSVKPVTVRSRSGGFVAPAIAAIQHVAGGPGGAPYVANSIFDRLDRKVGRSSHMNPTYDYFNANQFGATNLAPTRASMSSSSSSSSSIQTAPAQRSVAPRSTSVQPQTQRKITQTRPVGSAPPVKGAKQRGRNKLGNAGGPSGSRRVSLGGALQVGAGR